MILRAWVVFSLHDHMVARVDIYYGPDLTHFLKFDEVSDCLVSG